MVDSAFNLLAFLIDYSHRLPVRETCRRYFYGNDECEGTLE